MGKEEVFLREVEGKKEKANIKMYLGHITLAPPSALCHIIYPQNEGTSVSTKRVETQPA